MKREFNWARITLAFLIALFLFTFGLLAGYTAKNIVQSASLSLQETTQNEIVSLETIFLLDSEFPCNLETLKITSKKLDNIGELITVLEQKKGKNDKEVLELKKIYTILEIRHYLLMKERNNKCGHDYSFFFYLYSNAKECYTQTKEAQTILTYLRNKHDFVRVYSFDMDLDSDITRFLKEKYRADECVTIVLDGEKIEFVPKNANELETFFLEKRTRAKK